ncbi:hypothetical protein ACK3TF_001683 [Chlorella vulgaris]
MSLFNASSFSLGSGGRQLDPAAEISRLLNQHSHHWQTLEKEIAAVKGKQQAAERAYPAALQAKEEERAAALAADSEAAALEAEAVHCRAELQSSQAACNRLMEEVEALKAELAGITAVADQARDLKAAHPAAFLVEA